MADHLTLPQLESYLWGAAVILRGLIDAGDYKQFIFPLVFYKRLSDVWDEDYAAALASYDGNAELARAEADERFVIPTGTHFNDVRQQPKDIGRHLQTAMRAIEAANPGRFDGIFGDAPWTNRERLPDATLKNLLEHVATQTLSIANVPEDTLGDAYEYLIGRFADDGGHTAQEFYTNRTVVHVMTQMLRPQAGERIYDPTCGTGGMLIAALAEVKRRGGEHRTLGLFGQERNHMTASIARMNLVLHGVEDFHIARGDTLEAPHFTAQDRLASFDVVLANPPYSIKRWNRDAWAADAWGRNSLGTPPQGRADYAFFQHILSSLDPHSGRCAILFPHGVLFRREEEAMRRKLIESDRLDCVLGLGPNLFFNSPMEACVVICRAQKPPERQGRVLFIDAVNEIARERAYSFLKPEHQQRIADAYHAFTDQPGFCRVASLEQIAGNGHSLSIPLYVKRSLIRSGADTGKPADQRSLREVWDDWEQDGRAFWQQMDALVKTLDGLIADQPDSTTKHQ
ncbi:class I SAM-dependent DNA methyltransferase [Thiohalocapsa sp. ML1]|uniref:type I restriction-modification system subunit M n=1 Tax=Thiohalocapsa sp. ML1 TaxID=1431688 RepID=UPI0007323E7C|nr:class I SAM-dependent DNA methyltransferase [Thiohalocapsa sp. ML1]